MFTYKRSDRELLVYLIGNASTNGGDASRVGAFFSSLAVWRCRHAEVRRGRGDVALQSVCCVCPSSCNIFCLVTSA